MIELIIELELRSSKLAIEIQIELSQGGTCALSIIALSTVTLKLKLQTRQLYWKMF